MIGTGTGKKYGKYGAIRSESSDGRSFASKGERDCYAYLRLLERDGKLDLIECQVTTQLTAGITHKTDFKCFDLVKGETIWVEYKGFVDQRWRDIRKLWAHFGPGPLRVYGGYGLRMKLMDEIIPVNYVRP